MSELLRSGRYVPRGGFGHETRKRVVATMCMSVLKSAPFHNKMVALEMYLKLAGQVHAYQHDYDEDGERTCPNNINMSPLASSATTHDTGNK